jgi:hypothetical protein
MSSKETAEAILIVLKKIGKWIFYFALIILLIFLVFHAQSKIQDYFQNRPQIIDRLKGIELGEKFQDFMFRNEGFVLETEEDKKTDDVRHYRNKEKSLTVRVEDDKVVRVVYACNEKYDSFDLNGIDCGSIGDKVLEKYGRELNVHCLKKKNDDDYLKYRVYDAVRYGVRYHIVSNKVLAFDISSPAMLGNVDGFMMKKLWAPC